MNKCRRRGHKGRRTPPLSKALHSIYRKRTNVKKPMGRRARRARDDLSRAMAEGGHGTATREEDSPRYLSLPCSFPLPLEKEKLPTSNFCPPNGCCRGNGDRKVMSGQIWEHTPEQRVAASTFHRYSRGFRLVIPQADAWPNPISLRYRSTCCNHEARGRPIGLLHPRDSLAERIW